MGVELPPKSQQIFKPPGRQNRHQAITATRVGLGELQSTSGSRSCSVPLVEWEISMRLAC